METAIYIYVFCSLALYSTTINTVGKKIMAFQFTEILAT